MNKIFALIVLTSFALGERVTLVRNAAQQIPRNPTNENLTLNLVSETGTQTMPVQRFQQMRLFRGFEPLQPARGREVLNVLVLRAEFVEDDEPSTTGNGKMDLVGFGEPADGLFYDPPHTKRYFKRQMEFLSNYYKVNSFGNCIVNWTVKPDQPTHSYQLPHKMRYYSGFDRYDPETGFVYYNVYAMEMGLVRILADAIAAADLDETIDFSNYDAVLIFHAGTLLQSSLNFFRFCDIPSATIPPAALEFYIGTPYILANAGTDTIWGAGINSEMARIDEYMVGNIGTVVHEFGHTLGLPDLYDITGWSNGVGAWDLMGTGGWVGSPFAGAPEGALPANMGAWTRYAKGWVDPGVVTTETVITIRASEIDTTQYALANQTMVKIPISEAEFFLIENRQQDIRQKDTIIVDVEDGVPVYIDHGEFDFFLPGSGILVWHIDDNIVNAYWESNTMQVNPQHKGVDLEEADGIQHFDAWWYGDTLEYYGSYYDAFFVDSEGKANHNFGPLTNPNSDAYYGKSLITLDITSGHDTLMNLSVDFDMYQAGFPVVVHRGRPIYSVSYGDLNGDGDREVVAITRNGDIHAYNHDGTEYGTALVDTITTFLAVGDINADGTDDILFGSGLTLQCLDGLTLTSMANFPFTTENEILGAPLLFDINNDGNLEIIFGSRDRKLYCLGATGTNIIHFPVFLSTEIVSTPCVFNKDENQIGVLGSNGAFYIVDESGILKTFTDSEHNMITFASPIVGDIDRDGNPEAVIINGYGTIYIYGKDTLEQKFDILIDTTFYMTPALADIDDDGYLEIIMPNSSRALYVGNRNGTSENNFPVFFENYIFYPLLVANLDNQGKEEIIFGLGTSDSLGSGQLKIINNRNQEFDFSPLFGEGGFSFPGVIFNIDNDERLELACGSDSGTLYIWEFWGTQVSWSGYMNSPKNWGYFEGDLVQPQVAQGLLGSFYIYPSPVERTGRVRFFLNQAATVKVDILDIAGHKIGGVTMANTTANEYNEVAFDFTKQANGVYILRVEAKNGSQSEVKFKKFAVLK
ncbi:MAG: immune inhibitor A [candidate division WOR-3 bacterium]|nr:MAG: immune inhibitor A [candidate division WOR-3 bacterium]